MIIQLEILKNFESEYQKDKFDEFFRRVYADIDCTGMCGNYEAETAIMLADAFEKSKPIC